MPDDFKVEDSSAVYRLKDGLFMIVFKPEAIIDLRTARRVVKKRQQLMAGLLLPTLTIINNDYLILDRAAFRHLASKDAIAGVTAGAIVINSTLERLLTNFSLSFYRHEVPLRVFKSKTNAKLWLLNYLNVDVDVSH